MKKIIFLLFISTIVVSACSNNNIKELNQDTSISSAKKEEINYYPLKNGLSWTYKLTQTQNGQSNNKFKEMTMSVIDEKQEDGYKSYVLKRFYPDSNIQPNQTLAKVFTDRIELSRYVQPEIFSNLNSTMAKNSTNLKTNNYIISMKFPLTVGDSWSGRDFKEGVETISVEKFETITVPAGTFDCVKVKHNLKYNAGNEDNLYYWYGANKGMVKLHEEITIQYGGQLLKMAADGELIK